MSTNTSWLRFLPKFIRTRFEGRTNLLKVLGNASWLSGEKVLNLFVGLFVGAWVARYLGPEQFGLLNYAMAFVALFVPLATLGLDNIVVRDIVRDTTNRDKILGTSFVLKLVGGVVVVLVASGATFLMNPEDTLTHMLVIVLSVGTLIQSFDVIDFWFRSQVQSKYVAWSRSAALGVVALIRIVLILMQAPLLAFVVANVVQHVITALGFLVCYRSQGYRIAMWKVDFSQVKALLKDSWPLILSSIAIMIYMKIDQIMLKEMVGEQATGIYSAAVRLSELWYFIPMAIAASVLPSITEAKQYSEHLYYQRLQKLFDGMTALSFAIIIAVIPLSGFIITLLYGEAYRESVPILNIHIFACLFVFLGFTQGSWIITENLSHLAFIRSLSGAFVNILLNVVFIPVYAGIGAAIATVISYGFALVFFNLFYPKARVIFVMQMKSFFFFRYIFLNK
jgi:polysaccharide transporter, PST family